MNDIFQAVYKSLKFLSKVSGFTYHEVNIIIYYILTPFILVYFLGKVVSNKKLVYIYLLIIFLILLIIPDFEAFSTKLFNYSVDFLNWFKILGLNYVQASVVICVLLPFMLLIFLILKNKRNPKTNSH